MPSWTVGQLEWVRVGRAVLVEERPLSSNRPCRWRAETEVDRLVLPLSRRVSTVSVGCLYRVTRLCFWVDRVAHRHSERPAGLSLTPFDVVSGPSADKHDSRGKIDFPQNIWRKFALTRPPRQPRCPRIIIIIIILCPRGNRFSWPALRGGPSRQSEFIRVGSSREDCYDEFFSASRRGKIGKNSF